MTLAFLWCWQELLEKDPLLPCLGIPKTGLGQDGDMGRALGRDKALFSPIRLSRISPSAALAGVRQGTHVWLDQYMDIPRG